MPSSINVSDLKILAKTRLDDAITLYKQERYDGAIYLCGYVVELALKYKVCQKLGWDKYLPAKFDNDRTFYTHKLESLKFLSGMQDIFDEHSLNFNPELNIHWEIIKVWNESLRYDVDSKTKEEVKVLLCASFKLFRELTK